MIYKLRRVNLFKKNKIKMMCQMYCQTKYFITLNKKEFIVNGLKYNKLSLNLFNPKTYKIF